MAVNRELRWVIGAHPARTLVRAAVLAVASYAFFGYVLRPFRVQGVSMEPTVRDGSIRFGWMLAYRSAEPRPGDVVMIRMAGRRMMYLKRVLAVPGDTVRFDGGVLWVNETRREEPYVRLKGDWRTEATTLAPGEYLVAGDNRSAALEFHAAGVTTRDRILGRLAW